MSYFLLDFSSTICHSITVYQPLSSIPISVLSAILCLEALLLVSPSLSAEELQPRKLPYVEPDPWSILLSIADADWQ